MAMIWSSGGELGWTGPLEPIGKGRGGIGIPASGLAEAVAAALWVGAADAVVVGAAAVPEGEAPGAGFGSSSHAARARSAAVARQGPARRMSRLIPRSRRGRTF